MADSSALSSDSLPHTASSAPHFPDFAGAIALLGAALLLSYGADAGALVAASLWDGALPAVFTHGIANMLTFGVTAWVGYRLADRPLHAVFPFQAVPLKTIPGIVLLLLGVSLLLLEGTALLTQVAPIPPSLAALFQDVTVGSGVMGVFFVVFAGPLTEELLFRGVILGGLLSHHRARWAIVASAVLFGVVHLNLWQFVPAFGTGLVSGWLFVRTGSLWPCVAFHAAYNAVFGFAAVPMLDALGLGYLAYATNGVLPLLPGWLLAVALGLTAAGGGLMRWALAASPASE